MISYREANSHDEDDILKIIEEVLKPYGLSLEPNDADKDVTSLEKYYFNNNGWFQVVLHNNRVIGSVGVYKVNSEECELRKMYLLTRYQGQGIGKTLMDNAINKAKKLGYKKMSLQTSSKLNKALPLYEKYNFKRNCGEVCSRCDISMEKEL